MKSNNPFESLSLELKEGFSLLLEEIKKANNSGSEKAQSEEILTVKEAAEFLNLSIYSIYAKTSRKEIPYHKSGRKLHFFKVDLINWLKKTRIKTNAEIEEEAEEYLINQKNRSSRKSRV
ncbi:MULTISPECIES: helix-turn-helix domain-containing protein [Algoriphagus]|uniref:helix-turn-helix domain-containing protein n=1 Tax=Algoriphagus TaxID=246875 RepID=UPI0007169080|nr:MULTISPECIES: helix-turn-helix domain-containing protein [Algoriphagus]